MAGTKMEKENPATNTILPRFSISIFWQIGQKQWMLPGCLYISTLYQPYIKISVGSNPNIMNLELR